jgi:DNA-binding LacI/PurR family transcriptional regulator
MITIKTVAKHANVSIGTVSNVLSGNRPVSDEVRQRVTEAIEKLGYQPNLVASSLVTGRTNTIGMVVSDYLIAGLIHGIDLEVKRMGYSLLVSKLDRDEDPLKQLRLLLGRRVDGIIWCIPEEETSHDWIKDFQNESGIPIVLALCTPKPNYSSVWMDNYSGAYQATEHLIMHGCRKIAHIAGPILNRESKDRKAAWECALKEARLEPSRVVACEWGIQNGWHAMQQLLEIAPDLDGVFVAADAQAIGAINYLRHSGRRVPEDVKVVGFDDVGDLDYYDPPLTSIHQDYGSLGECLIKVLSRHIQDPLAEPEEKVLPTRLMIRESCGCHPDIKRNALGRISLSH